jgi:hypothetical protein
VLHELVGEGLDGESRFETDFKNVGFSERSLSTILIRMTRPALRKDIHEVISFVSSDSEGHNHKRFISTVPNGSPPNI